MRTLGLTLLTFMCVTTALAQTGQSAAPEVQTLFEHLQEGATASEAASKLEKLGKESAAARKYISGHLPALIKSSRGRVWVYSVQLAGDLKLKTAAPVLAPYLQQWNTIAGMTDFAATARFGNDPAAKSLVEIGEPSVRPVARVLEEGNKIGRWRSARILLHIGSPAALLALRKHVPSEKDPRLRGYIEDSLKTRPRTAAGNRQ